jgi:hypothetical protein
MGDPVIFQSLPKAEELEDNVENSELGMNEDELHLK